MGLYLNIEPCPGEEVGKGLAFLDPEAMGEQDIRPGDTFTWTGPHYRLAG